MASREKAHPSLNAAMMLIANANQLYYALVARETQMALIIGQGSTLII